MASSDATNVEMRINRDGDEYVLNGRKWWTSGAMRERCRILIVMGKTDPDGPTYRQQSMILVPLDTPGGDGAAQPAGVRLRRSGGPRRGRVRQRPRAGLQPDRERGRRLPDLPGPARTRPDPPLHARDRRRRARARADVPPSRLAGHVRPAGERAGQRPGLDRRVADRDRDGPAADDEGGLADGHRRQQARADGDLGDQGRGAERRAAGGRPGDPGPRRRRRVRTTSRWR